MATALQYISMNFRSEVLKSRRSFTFWLTMIGAAFVPLVYAFAYIFKTKYFIPGPGVNPWTKFFMHEWEVVGFLLLPFYVILIGTMLGQTEQKAVAWKQILSQPIPRWSIYAAKLMMVTFTVLCCYGLFFVFTMLAGGIAGLLFPELKFLSVKPLFSMELLRGLKLFICSLSLIGIHTWLGIRFKNLALPTGTGVVMIILAVILLQGWKGVYLFPYAYPVLTLQQFGNPGLLKHEWFSLGYFLLFSIIGYVDFMRRKDY
jgi:hypothetical protein